MKRGETLLAVLAIAAGLCPSDLLCQRAVAQLNFVQPQTIYSQNPLRTRKVSQSPAARQRSRQSSAGPVQPVPPAARAAFQPAPRELTPQQASPAVVRPAQPMAPTRQRARVAQPAPQEMAAEPVYLATSANYAPEGEIVPEGEMIFPPASGDCNCGPGGVSSGCAIGNECWSEPGCGCEACCGAPVGCGDWVEPGCGFDPSCGCPGQGCTCFCRCIRHCTIFGGVHGFRNPLDLGSQNNFGAQIGFNLATRLPLAHRMGLQVGYAFVGSDLSGNAALNTSDTHDQQFLTVGLFRRARRGLQFGVAWDLVRDESFIEGKDMHQLRPEISMLNGRGGEIGFWSAGHTNSADALLIDPMGGGALARRVQAVDQYNFFYRFHLQRLGTTRFWLGFTNDSRGIIGSDMLIPLNDRWSVQGGVNYMFPDRSLQGAGALEEAWNLSVNIVWSFRCRARRSFGSPYRPLFQVADNGSFILDERP